MEEWKWKEEMDGCNWKGGIKGRSKYKIVIGKE